MYTIGKALQSTKRAHPAELDAWRSEITNLLRTGPKRVVVLLDDLDRLYDYEIREVAQLVRLTGEFPNVVYVVAYDRDRLEQALGQGGTGRGYLGKVIQVPLDLPRPHAELLQQLVIDCLTAAIKPLPDRLWQQDRWSEIYSLGVRPLIQTARDAKRLANGLLVAALEIGTDVNGVDLLAVTALRLFAQPVYRRMTTDRDLFLSSWDEGRPGGSGKDARVEQVASLLEELDEGVRPPVLSLLRGLFPQVDGAYANTINANPTVRDDLRICALASYSRYFTLSLPSGAISENQLSELFDLLPGHRDEFQRQVRGLLQSELSSNFVERLFTRVSGLAIAERLPTIRRLLDLFSQFSAEPREFFGGSEQVRLGLLAMEALEGIDDPRQRQQAALDFIRADDLKGAIYVAYGCAPDSQNREKLLDDDHFAAVRGLLLRRLRGLSNEQVLSTVPFSVFAALDKWGEKGEGTRLAQGILARDEDFVRLLRAAQTMELSLTKAGDVRRRVYVNPRELRLVMPFEKWQSRAQELYSPSRWTEEERRLLDSVMNPLESDRDG